MNNQITYDGLKSQLIEIENFKNIDKKVIHIDGKSLLICGANGSGKSSFIQAITSTMDKKNLPSEPVKKGEERARISHKIAGNLHGEYHEYTVELYFTQKDQSGRLKVFNKDGSEMKSPSTLIKSIIGAVSFNPTEWLNAPKAKKLEILKARTGRGHDIDLINKKIGEEKEKKKFKAKRAEELNATIGNHEFTKEEIEIYSKVIDLKPLQQSMTEISVAQREYDDFQNRYQGLDVEINNSNSTINRAKNELQRLKEAYEKSVQAQNEIIAHETSQINIAENKKKQGEEWFQQNSRPSMDSVNKSMNDAILHNEKHGRIGRLAEQRREMIASSQEVDKIDAEIKKMEAARTKIFETCQLPVPGLKITEDEIYLDDMPLEEGQVNTAKLFDVSVDIAIALNPNLKVIFIHDGNQFDRAHLRKIVEKIESHGYMAIIEFVSFEGNDFDVKFTEKEFA